MRSSKLLNLAILFTILPFLFSCTQDEGYGGTSSIIGQVYIKYYNDDFSLFLYEEPAGDEEVYIVFGDEEASGDNVNTTYTGDFKFDYLFPGSYDIVFYSLDTSRPYLDEQPVVLNVSLDREEDRNLGIQYIYKSKDWDEGSSTIRGQIFLINYKSESIWPDYMIVKDTSYAQDIDVYLVYGSHLQYDERIRTMDDGSFAFTNLIPGNYRIFVYSEDLSGATQYQVVERTATISDDMQLIDLGIIYTEKL
ncbi:MAG: hypothetical protein K9I34_00050 [Bacteroidales bacterium]|nr:hypothetical protein [Bacteroidales bacterium]